MRLDILSAESLGVRGLCCRVEAGERVIVIDPGVALGIRRYGLPPHPVQIAAGRAVRRRIVAALEGATDMVFSHFHGDHVPLFEPNPYQLGFSHLPPSIKTLRVWSLSPAGQSFTSQARARDLMDLLGPHFQEAEGGAATRSLVGSTPALFRQISCHEGNFRGAIPDELRCRTRQWLPVNETLTGSARLAVWTPFTWPVCDRGCAR